MGAIYFIGQCFVKSSALEANKALGALNSHYRFAGVSYFILLLESQRASFFTLSLATLAKPFPELLILFFSFKEVVLITVRYVLAPLVAFGPIFSRSK